MVRMVRPKVRNELKQAKTAYKDQKRPKTTQKK